MKIACRLLLFLVPPVLAGVLAYGSSQQPAGGAKSKPPATPADWVTVTNDAKTCKLSLPPAWVQPDSDGIWGRMDQGEMAMFVEDEETQQAGDWEPLHRVIEKRKSTGAKVEILEETPERIIFQSPHGSILATMSFRRSPKTLCAVQIGVPAGDPEQVKIARQIAESLTTLP